MIDAKKKDANLSEDFFRLKCRESFDLFDANGSGEINVKELKYALEKVIGDGVVISMQGAMNMIAAFD